MTDKALLRQLRAKLEPLGFTYEGVNRSNHLVWRHPDAGDLVTPARRGSHRQLDNALATAKRLLRRQQQHVPGR